jgi:sugar-specific transcriptional regulator TrmB/predicted hydrocarbon binding protein
MAQHQTDLAERLVDSGLDSKEARVILTLSTGSPLKASEIGTRVGITRMDAYNTLRRLQDSGLVMATVDKPMRFTGLSIEEIFQHLIHREEQELRRLKAHLDEYAEENLSRDSGQSRPPQKEATFSVIKERSHIHAAMERLIEDAEQEIWLLLGRWGILHLVKTGALSAVNEAARRGVTVRVLATLDKKTVKFFEQLDDSIEVRHSDAVSMHGLTVDGEVAIQSVSLEANPVGRGKEDAALVIEAHDFLSAHTDLIESTWKGATAYSSAVTRIEKGEIVEPLRVSLGEGSFYRRLKEMIASDVEDQHPNNIGWTNAVLRRGERMLTPEPSLPAFEVLGIDTSELMRNIGRRIGEEIAMELSEIDDDAEFWTQLAVEWAEMGMGRLVVQGDPVEVVRVEDSGSCGNAPQFGGPFCHLDEGILEGIIQLRFGVHATAVERECTAAGQDHCHFDIVFTGNNT